MLLCSFFDSVTSDGLGSTLHLILDIETLFMDNNIFYIMVFGLM